MNIEGANYISLSDILQKIGCTIIKQKGNDVWYNSPFRKEMTASFHINLSKNVWYDFGEAKGGRVIQFVKSYLESQGEDHTIIDALRWLSNMQGKVIQHVISSDELPKEELTLNLRKVNSVQHPMLVDYLNKRKIPISAAKKYLKEAHVHNRNSGKSFFALAMENENGGYELRNKFFKGCLSAKGISFIRGSKVLPEDIHVFEGALDFLSALTLQSANTFEGDVIILNSLSCLHHVFPYIKNYSYKTLHSWLDNDTAGINASAYLKKAIKADANLDFKSMHEIYAPHKDVNAWHMQRVN